MAYRLDFSKAFKSELSDVVGYIISDFSNPPAAQKLAKKVREALERIEENPYLYPLYHNDAIAAKGYRYIVIGSYLLFYTVDEDKKIVNVARFIYGKREVEKLL